MTTTTATATQSINTEARYVDTYGILDIVSTVDTAKEVRKALKEAFPAVRFAVRAQGNSVMSIAWTDGPTESEVEKVSQQFVGVIGHRSLCGDYFESMSYKDNGQGAHYDLQVLLHSRSVSDEAVEAARQSVIALSGMDEQSFLTMWKGETAADFRGIEAVLSEVQNTYGQNVGWGQLFASKFRGSELNRLALMITDTQSY